MNKRLTFFRLIMAVISMIIEQAAIFAIWRWLLPGYGIKLGVWVLIVAMAGWLVIGTGLYIFGTNALKKQVTTGLTTLIGFEGEAASDLNPEGTVKVNGEIWSALAEDGTIEKGKSITVVGEDGLKLRVNKIK
jgi:membrane-bound ClpP family serine protease